MCLFGDCQYLNLRFVFRKCDVLNRGLSGYNSRWAKMILPRLINCQNTADTNIAAVTVFFGANDCALEGTLNFRVILSWITECIFAHHCFNTRNPKLFLSAVADKNPQQHVPVQEYSENLKEMARFLASAGVSADRVIFISPPPVHEPAWEKECMLKGSIYSHHLTWSHHQPGFKASGWFFLSISGFPLNRLNSVAGQYAQACVQAAAQCGTDVLDLWSLMQKDSQVS